MDNILIVDDEEDILELLFDVVKKWGHLPIIARDGEDALQKVQDVPIDLVLSDIRMPKMDGMTFLEKLKKINPNLTVILLTGYPSVESAVLSMKEGAYDYLVKPINLDELKEKIDRGLERSKLSHSLKLLKGVNWSLLISIPFWLILGIFLARLLR
ncbi:response regulator [candidate division KSB1 bacterium]|nr:response regulator [candidate division KSB1 bacterium]